MCAPETLLEFGNGASKPLPGANPNDSPFSYFFVDLGNGAVVPGKDGGVVVNPDGGIVMSPMPHTQTLSPDAVSFGAWKGGRGTGYPRRGGGEVNGAGSDPS